jgi:hypothetical protein
MKHATASSLDQLDPLLGQLRDIASLMEKQRGIFYVKSKAFLHFHEDAAGLFADLRVATDWERYPVTTAGERKIVLETVRDALRLR